MKRHQYSEALTRALDDLRREWGFPPSFGLRQFVQRWEQFVKNVEVGYTGGLDDYLQNLEIRDSLNTFLKRLPPEEREEVTGLLSPWDERLRFATRPAKRSLVSGVNEVDRFWWDRIPLRLTGQLLADLQEEGIFF